MHDVFDRQDRTWRDAVLPPALPAVAVEAAHPDFWRQVRRPQRRRRRHVGLRRVGAGGQTHAHFGVTAGAVADAAACVRG